MSARRAASLRASSAALLLALGLAACHGETGPCAGDNCPTIPGCEADVAVVCDPEHVCLERVCEGVGWICGAVEGEVVEGKPRKRYAWYRKSAPCSDGEPCTGGDVCVGGACQGTPLACKTPPANTCLDPSRLAAYQPEGTCNQGACEYPTKEITCQQGCVSGKCTGEPCLGVSCTTPPGPCHKTPGTCAEGSCGYEALPAGSACQPVDPCLGAGSCDDKGSCTGAAVSCTRPHATGGSCVKGVCQGFACEAGWGNCNNNWDDGCETPLDTVQNCGKCGGSCGAPANAAPACTSGKCTLKCTSPWQDCDKSYANGCEIPVGVANKCSSAGLQSFSGSTPPCGTAYCGAKTGTDIKSFGTWHCVWCTQCHHFSNGWSWCLGDGKFSSARCSSCCNSGDQDKTCPR